MSSIQFQTPIEALQQSFDETNAELTVESGFESKQISVPKQISSSIAKAMVVSKLDFDEDVAPPSFSIVPAPGAPPNIVKESELRQVVEEIEQIFQSWKEGFHKKLSETDDKLRALAQEIWNQAKQHGKSVEEILRRMQTHLYRWVLANSTVDSFDVGSGTSKITFAPDKVTSQGKFSFGPIGDSISSIEGIIGVLKIIPSISIEVEVEYTQKKEDKATTGRGKKEEKS